MSPPAPPATARVAAPDSARLYGRRIVGSRAGVVAVLALALALSAACRRQAKSPELAYQRLGAALQSGDARALFGALDQQTQWGWMTVQRSHRECYDIVLSTFPPGAARERELERLGPAATAADAAELFAREAGANALGYLRPLAPSSATPRFERKGTTAEAILPSGARLVFGQGNDEGWGFAGLRDDALDREKRAIADLDLIKASAADFERAAARAGR